MNNNFNNNEQDLIIKGKIEKREKFDTMLAYILIVVLLVCIGIVVLVKLNEDKEEDTPPVEEYTPTYISLEEISSSLNSSSLVDRYIEEGASFTSSVSGNSLIVTYTKEDISLSLNIPAVGNELMVTISNDSAQFATEIYKEIANTICMYYGNEEKHCRNTIEYLPEEGTDGIRFESAGENNTVYITTTQSIPVSTEEVYTETTVTDINFNNYRLELTDAKVYGISVTTSDANLSVTGKVESTSNLSVVVKLYDIENNVLGENKYEYNEENPLNGTGNFEINFIISETLKLENISKYSIEIVK